MIGGGGHLYGDTRHRESIRTYEAKLHAYSSANFKWLLGTLIPSSNLQSILSDWGGGGGGGGGGTGKILVTGGGGGGGGHMPPVPTPMIEHS